MRLQHSVTKHKEAIIVSFLIILAIVGYAVAYCPPAQQPTKDKEIIYIADKASENKVKTPATILPKEEPNGEIYTVTAYDLSVQSCGKPVGHPQYGKTANGYSLAGHTWDSAKSIAVDTKHIPLGSKVLIKFSDEKFHKYNGIYTARDTGGGVKGLHIDFFMGDFESNEPSNIALAFGSRKAEVIIL